MAVVMGLSQSIVVKSEFSVPRSDGGTRGSTPGAYVERYMARADAIDAIFPLYGENVDAYVSGYMVREGAVVPMSHGPRDGVAFTSGNTSMSASEVRDVSRRIQELFDDGHTVIKTVVSFDDDYLRETGVMDPDFVSMRRGDKMGRVDQMKLRLAIIEGMERMSRRFDDVVWVGVIQFDTMHIHAHLAIVDAGEGRVTCGGEQRGKLSQSDMSRLRRGIDSSLTLGAHVRPYARQISSERTRARHLVQERVMSDLVREDSVRLILARLPEDKSMWRAGSHRNEMRAANRMCREYVRRVLSMPSSGWSGVIDALDAYATSRAEREGLSEFEREGLVARGVERIEDSCVDGVYAVLRDVDATRLEKTPPAVLAIARDTLDIDVPASAMSEMTYRVRTYARRLRDHRGKRDDFHDAVRSYEAAEGVSEASRAAYEYYLFEESYQERVMAKYQHLLPLAAWRRSWTDDVRVYLAHLSELDAWHEVMRDPVLKTLDVRAAEVWGHERYGLDGCGLLLSAPALFEEQMAAREARVRIERENLDFRMAGDGLSIEMLDGPRRRARIVRKPAHDFTNVKAMDLHDMSFDFDHELRIPMGFVNQFTELARERQELYDGACEYLRRTGQEHVIEALPGHDVARMSAFAAELGHTGVLSSLRGSANAVAPREEVPLIRTGLDRAAIREIEDTIHGFSPRELGI